MERTTSKARLGFLPLLLMAVVLIVGFLVTWLESQSAMASMADTIRLDARMVAATLDPDRIARLTGTKADLDSADFRFLREQLMRVRAANPKYRYLYLMGKKPGGIPFFFMDSEPASSPDYSPPGQVYTENTPDITQALDQKVEVVSPPEKDRWGTWVSGLIPIRRPVSGEVLALFGMDVDARDWRHMYLLRVLTPMALTLLALVLLVLMVLVQRYYQRLRENRFLERSEREARSLLEVLRNENLARQKAEQDRSRLQAQLLHSQKMESVGRLAGGVAHDFNNMLGVILGRTELLLQQTPTDESAYAELREIQKAAERSVDLTHQLLAFARKQTAAPKLLDLNPTVGGMLKMIRRLIGEDIDLVWTPDPEPSFVKIDPSQLDQILANLCVNARDAVTEAGRIVISTENVLFEEKDCRDSAERRPGEFVRLSVSDNGSGMDQSALANLFEPFFTTKEVGKGTGLGLATVYGIVKQNEGFIHVDSEPGRGTTFQVFLPRQPEESETSREPSSNVAASQGKETLLLVEDEPSLLAMTATLLRRQGYQVLTASLPSEALRLAERHKGPIHILVTDVVMPEMNGRELAARLPAFSPGIKSLYMSGYTSDIIANHGVLEEGVAFIQKPFTMRELSAKVREVLDKP